MEFVVSSAQEFVIFMLKWLEIGLNLSKTEMLGGQHWGMITCKGLGSCYTRPLLNIHGQKKMQKKMPPKTKICLPNFTHPVFSFIHPVAKILPKPPDYMFHSP